MCVYIMTALQDQDCVCVCLCGGRVCLVGKVSNTNTKVRNKVAQGELPLHSQLCDISGQYLLQHCPVISAREERGGRGKEVCKNYTSSITTNYRQLLGRTVLVTLSTKMLPNFVTRHFDYRLLREYLILDSSHQHPGLSWYM